VPNSSVGPDSERDTDTESGDGAVATGGTYTLLIRVPAAVTVDVGALGSHALSAGAYAYTGSALGAGGFSRVDRHRRVARGDHHVRHWHIDYLLGHPDTDLDRVVRSVGVDIECPVARRLPTGPIGGFGASDCDCTDHLAAGATLDGVASRVLEAHETAARRGDDDSVSDAVALDVAAGAGGSASAGR